MIIYAENTTKLEKVELETVLDQSTSAEIEQYTQQFLSLAKTSTENTVAMCEVLHKAKQAFKEKDTKNVLFTELCKSIGYDKGANDPTIKKFLRIGESAERFRPYLDRLPNSWTTLYEITQLDEELFNQAIEEGAINIKMLGKEVRSLKQINQTTEKLTTLPEKKLSIEILLSADTNKVTLENLLKELEALKLNFKFEMHTDSFAKTVLDQPT
jgi:hypothetical protein